MADRIEVGPNYLQIEGVLQSKAKNGEIGFSGRSPRQLSLIVSPTYPLLDALALDEFKRGLLPNLGPVYQLNSVDSLLDRQGGLSYGVLVFREEQEQGGARIWVRVFPDDQLAYSMFTWESEVGERYPSTPQFEGLTRGLNKDQLAALRENPPGFNQKLKEQIERMRKEPPHYGFLPIGGISQYPAFIAGFSKIP